MHTRILAGLELRAGAELDATEAQFVLRAPLQDDVILAVDASGAANALAQAIDKAKGAGFQFAAPTQFTASDRLEKLIQASEALSQ
jgi:D-arabinose 5-phosphate isomerase GutQ